MVIRLRDRGSHDGFALPVDARSVTRISMPLERRRVYYSGRVQGVGFRATCRWLAGGFEVAGYVRNLPDGRVEVVAEGESAELDRFLAAIQERDGRIHTSIDVGTRTDRVDPPLCTVSPSASELTGIPVSSLDRSNSFVLIRSLIVHPPAIIDHNTMKSLTIALATAKETIRQPAFFVMAVLRRSPR